MKIAIIGEGFGKRVVAPVFEHLGCQTVVVSPHDNEAVRQACAADVDLVSVHSPPFLHHQHVMWALDNGHPVLCDKPFGRNATQARAMRDRASELGTLNFLDFEFRCQPARLELRRLLDAGAIGVLQHVSWSFIGSGLRAQKHRWLFDANLAGGWVGAWGSHAIDTLRWLFRCEIAACGGLRRIETPLRPDRNGVEQPCTAEDAFTAWFRMDNDRTASVDTAYSSTVTIPQRLLLTGSEGTLELVDDSRLALWRPRAEVETLHFSPTSGDPHIPALTGWLTQVCSALRDNRQVTPSFDDGVAVADVIERLRNMPLLCNAC